MALTDIDIATAALVSIGGQPITSFTPSNPTRESKIAANTYFRYRKEELSGTPWNFATKTIELSQSAGSPVNTKFTYHYTTPSDVLWLQSITTIDGFAIGYDTDGTLILTNSSRVLGRYVADVPTDQFREFFVRLLVSRCAYEWAIPLTGRGTLYDRKFSQYNIDLLDGKGLDAREKPPADFIQASNSPLELARLRD